MAAVGVMSQMATAGGTPVWDDDFESYPTGVLVPQGGWEAWADDPGAANARVTTQQALSGTKSAQTSGVDDLVHLYSQSSGVFAYAAHMYLPAETTGTQFFILLNQYDGGGDGTNWSTQLGFDPAVGEVFSDFEDARLPLIYDEWVEVRVTINLDADTQEIFYGGDLLSAKGWSDGSGAGGTTTLAAVDLWANTASAVFWDDLSLVELDPEGACCLPEAGPGQCMEGLEQAACEALDPLARFQGIGSSCVAVDCPDLTKDGWLVTAPFSWTDDLCGKGDDCLLGGGGEDIQWVVEIPYDADWTFELCNGSFDSEIGVGTSVCSTDIGQDDDGCGFLFGPSQLTAALTAGTYYVTVDGFSGTDCGPFTLNVSAPCIDADYSSPAGDPEGEACSEDPDTTNGGCNSTPEVFTSVACGQTYNGIGWSNATTGSRDTDWYEIVTTETMRYRWGGKSELGTVYGLVDTGGTGDCADAEFLVPASTSVPCEGIDGSINLVLDAGTWWFFVGSDRSDEALCSTDGGYMYDVTLECTCTADMNFSGSVGFIELNLVLANWGPCAGCVADLNGDGSVGFVDLNLVLAQWGDCE